MNKKLSFVGVCFTGAYLVFLCWFLDGRMDAIKDLKLNELGDFLAGVFGPLTILWLILGFFQQGFELQQNTKALELQAEELRSSVEQQRELVAVTSRQVETEIAKLAEARAKEAESLKTRLVFSVNGKGEDSRGVNYYVTVTNVGAIAGRALFTPPECLVMHNGTRFASLSGLEVLRLEMTLLRDPRPDEFIGLSYVDSAGKSRETKFQLRLSEDGFLTDIVEVAG